MSKLNLCRSIYPIVTAALLSARRLATLLAATLAVSQSAQAATYTWTGATNGTWDTSSANWSGPGSVFVNANDALFSGTPTNNVTTATGLTIGAITLDNTFTGSVTMTGANTVSGATTISGGTLNLNIAGGLGASAITVNSGGILNFSAGNATYANAVSGAGVANVTTAAAGDAQLSGNWSGFTGTLNLSGSGNFKSRFVTNQANLISSSATINVNAGTTLYLNQALNYGANIHLFGAGNTENLGALRLEAGANQTGAVTLHGNSFIGANGSAATISGGIGETGGSFGFTKQGNNVLTLSGANTYTGVTTIGAGTLQFAKTASLYNGTTSSWTANNINVKNAATLGLNVGGTGEFTASDLNTLLTNISVAASATSGLQAGAIIGLNTTNASGGTFTQGNAIANSTGANGGVIHLTKLGTGTLVLDKVNTYTGGTRANAGTLVLSGGHTKAAGNTDFLSVNNVGAQNAVVKVTAGTHGFTDINLAEVTNARGAIYQSGGDLSSGIPGGGIGVRVASGGATYGYYSLSGGTLTNGTQDLGVGYGAGSTGVMDVTGGSVTTGSWLVLGRNGAANGLLNVTGGSVTSNSNNIALNWANTAGSISILNVGGGAGAASVTGVSNATNYFDVSQSNTVGTTGVANLLSNGTLTVGRVQSSNPGATALLNFNGGTLKATATNSGATFMTNANVDAVTVYSGGGTIDNNSTNITVSNVLGAATGNGVTSIAVTNGGSGYIGAPLVKITGGTGNTATGYAVMVDDGTGNGTYKVDSIVITSAGTYTVDPTTVTLTGGGASTAATLGSITTAANTSGGMTFAGTGTTTLSGVNTYTGGTTISSGTLLIGGAGQLGGGTYAGNISNAGTFIFGSSAAQTLSGVISGTGSLSKTTGAGTLTLSGANTYTGNTTVSAGTLLLDTTGSLTLAIGNNGVNTKITGSGILTLDGTFNFDLSGAAIADGNMWTIVDSGTLTESYLSNFAVSGFTQSSDIWTRIDGSNTWTFAESSGILSLSVVPEPNSWLLALGGMMFFAVSRRRRRIA